MKICWDNLEGLKYNRKTGKWGKNHKIYIYKEGCKNCGEPFLAQRQSKGKFCSLKCSKISTFHPWLNKKHSEETKRKISVSHIGKKHTEETKRKISKGSSKNNRMYGKVHTEETKEKLRRLNSGENNPMYGKMGKNSPLWKGGYGKIPLYDTYAPQIEWCEEVKRNEEDPNILEVKCTYCGRWYIPNLSDVTSRIIALKHFAGECRFYCSNGCKKACPIYHKTPKTLMKQDAIRAGRLQWLELDREVQPELRQLVLERDKYQCIKCNSMENLYCHHIYPVSTNPLESADIDNCITLCENCHKEVHKKDGCRYSQLHINIC